MRTPEDRLERFFEKVEIGDCWLWTASLHRGGYGQVGPSWGLTRYAHRWLWLTLVGPLPDGLELDHLCKVRRCVNPDHLEPVTHAENLRRARAAITASRRMAPKRTHCTEGHALTPDNTLHYPERGNERICRICHAVRAKSWRERRRVA